MIPAVPVFHQRRGLVPSGHSPFQHSPAAGGEAEPNPNLLRWSEEFQQAMWVKSGATVTANQAAAPDETMTMDRIVFDSEGTIGQTSATAAATGATASDLVTPGVAAERFSLTGTFDGAPYFFSVWMTGSGGVDVFIVLRRSSGFLLAEIVDFSDGATIHAWGAKLETPSLTAYVKREGV